MIVVDTSAIIAVLLLEPQGQACRDALVAADQRAMSAGTLTETMIVALGRSIRDTVEGLIADMNIEIVPISASFARQAADAYAHWGKGYHRAKLNFGDCFAYALAKDRGCSLLYVGDDFAQTDVVSALAPRVGFEPTTK